MLIFYLAYFLQFFSNQLATPRNLRSSNLSPTNWIPNGKLFAPISKGNEIDGKPIYVQIVENSGLPVLFKPFGATPDDDGVNTPWKSSKTYL